MALTDALSVACKALGLAADIYWQDGRTKYSVTGTQEPKVDRRRLLPKDKFNDNTLMAWINKYELESKAKGGRFSIASLLEANYANSKEDIQTIAANYEQFKINNNI